jgi:hypothetical protein
MTHIINGQDILEMLIAFGIGYLVCKIDNYSKDKKALTKYEQAKVLEALWHAERNAHPLNRRGWKRLSKEVEYKLSK